MRSIRKQDGAQAVEFALILPFLVLVVLAVLDFAFLAYNKAVLTNASREAARRGTVLTAAAWDPADVSQVACTYARAALINVGPTAITPNCDGTVGPTITVTPAAMPANPFNTQVTVTISYVSRGIVLFPLGSIWGTGAGTNHVGSPFTLTASTQMNHE
jgi:Flp pilus assembly protein TadG